MELFARCDREPERLLAVTEEGKRYTLGDLNAAAERIAAIPPLHREFRLPLHYSRKTVLKAVYGLSP